MLEPTWVPARMQDWCAPGGPLDGVGTLAELCGDATAASGPPGGRTGAGGLADASGRMDAGQVRDAVAARAAELTGRGVARGDVVSWQLPNCIEGVVLYRACWSIGAVAAPIHHLAGGSEVDQIIESLSPTAVFAEGLVLDVRPDGKHRAAAQPQSRRERPHESDMAVVLHTSGSSGAAKAVMHTHRALAYKARSMARIHGLTDSDTVLMPAPLAHVSGLLNGVLVPAAASMDTVLMPRWNPETALDLIESESVSFMVGPPTFFLGLQQAESFDPARVRSLRVVSVGGAGVTPQFVVSTTELFGAEVKRSYGSTEAPTITTASAGDDLPTRSRTEGRCTGEASIRIVDPDVGSPTDPGEVGEVQVCGPELFCGYTDRVRTSASVVSDGDGDWFRTGDLGFVDDEDRLTITGRMGNMIIRGGENIDASQVESHLVAHPAVNHAVAIGEPDERMGERVVAFVELAPGFGRDGFGVAECLVWFEDRGVARFWAPERIEVLERMPMLTSGKADRAGLARRIDH